jgi:hypothetical protein
MPEGPKCRVVLRSCGVPSMSDLKPLLAIGLVVLVGGSVVVVWKIQGWGMRDDFIQALRDGQIVAVHRDLQGKTWTDEEFATAAVLKVTPRITRQRAIIRTVHEGGRVMVARDRFAYQGTIRDSTTGVVHVFGYTRDSPHRWCWEAMDPDTLGPQLEQRLEQLKKMQEQKR